MKRAISAASRQRRKFWEAHLRQWQESGLSQTGYSRAHGLSDKSFVYWKQRIAAAGASVCLVEVSRLQRVPVQPSIQPLRLKVGNRYSIEIERDFDEQTLDRLLRVLGER